MKTYTLRFTDEAFAMLQRLAAADNRDIGHYIQVALKWKRYVDETKARGEKVLVTRGDDFLEIKSMA